MHSIDCAMILYTEEQINEEFVHRKIIGVFMTEEEASEMSEYYEGSHFCTVDHFYQMVADNEYHRGAYDVQNGLY